LVQHTKGVAVTGINLGDLRRLPVPLPPLSEQRRIADILDKADAIRRKRKEALLLGDELLRSAFLDMFGDPLINPKNWRIRPLSDAIGQLVAGWSANGEQRQHHDGEFGVLKVSAVSSGFFRAEEHKAVSAAAIDRPLISPKRGDLLFSRANTRELVAATCLVQEDHPFLFLPDKLWKIVPIPDVVMSEFLHYLFSHDRFRTQLTRTATGTSGSMLNVSMDKLRSQHAPLPPIPLQKRFADVVWTTLELRRHQQTGLRDGERLFESLVHDAFPAPIDRRETQERARC
jgi:type I restriction enzyme S subunit